MFALSLLKTPVYPWAFCPCLAVYLFTSLSARAVLHSPPPPPRPTPFLLLTHSPKARVLTADTAVVRGLR